MKKGYIFSAILGGTFFAVPYLALGVQLVPSLAISAVAYGAGTLIFKDRSKIDYSTKNTNLYEILKNAKSQTTQIFDISKQLEDRELIANVQDICNTSNKIIDTLSKNPGKLSQVNNFINYYLPVTIKILQRYDEIENQKLKGAVMKNKKSIAILMAAITLASCQSYKKVPYLQSYESLTDKSYKEIVINEVNQQDTLYDARIQPKDLLNITINTTDPQAAAPFNLTMQTYNNIAQSNASTTSQPALQQYLVDNAGEIDFPVIGRLQVGGLTKNAAENLIREQLRPYLKEIPIVTVRMSNYKISVLGEVNSPGTFTINNEKVNIFEALAMAGDMTIYGIRNNVKLIREDCNGQRNVISLNLNEQNILHSPYYYMQQNDILYIAPNKTKAKSASVSNSTTIWVSVITSLVSLASLIVNIVR